MSRVSKLATKTSPTVATPNAVNMEGFAAYSKSQELTVLQLLLTGTLGNTFYADEKQQVNEAKGILQEAAKNRPAFLIRAATFARNEGFMRSLPVMALAYLAASGYGEVESRFGKIIRTPNDLRDFMVTFSELRQGQGGRRVKRMVGSWLAANLNPYWIIKYGSEEKDGYSLKDMLITTHPRGLNPAFANYIIRDDPGEVVELVEFEAFKRSETYEDAMAHAKNGHLPMEVLTSMAGKFPNIWDAVAENSPIQATMKNLVSMNRHGALESHKAMITSRLTQDDAIAKAMLLPYQVYRAYEKAKQENLPVWVLDALRVMFDKSAKNVKTFPGKTLVACDFSGSMRSHPIWDASLLALTVARSCDSEAIRFDTDVYPWPVSSVDSIMTQAEAAIKTFNGGGTSTDVVVRYMNERAAKGIKFDVLWLVTDAQQNSTSDGMPAFYKALSMYRAKVNPNLKLIVINISSYSKSGELAPEGGLNWLSFGASLNLLNVITTAARAGEYLPDVAKDV